MMFKTIIAFKLEMLYIYNIGLGFPSLSSNIEYYGAKNLQKKGHMLRNSNMEFCTIVHESMRHGKSDR
jgi:hypothetical protein